MELFIDLDFLQNRLLVNFFLIKKNGGLEKKNKKQRKRKKSLIFDFELKFL